MPISADLLDDDEDVLVDLRPHWIFFLGPLILAAASIAVSAEVFHQFPNAPVGVVWLLALMIAAPVLWLLVRLTRWFGTSLVVTDRRIVLRSGVLGRQIVNLRLQRVVDTHCTQTPLERVIGAGRIVLEVEGEEGGMGLEDVRRPRVLQRIINRQLSQLDAGQQRSRSPDAGDLRSGQLQHFEHSDRTPPAGIPPVQADASSGSSITDQLVALDRLRRQGILSEEEFAATKAQLLRRI